MLDRSSVVQGPVILVVVLVSQVFEQVREEILDVLVVRLVFEVQRAAVLHVGYELRRESLAEFLKVGHDLLLLDLFVLFLDTSCPEPLPRKHTSQEVHEDVA